MSKRKTSEKVSEKMSEKTSEKMPEKALEKTTEKTTEKIYSIVSRGTVFVIPPMELTLGCAKTFFYHYENLSIPPART